MTCIDKYILQSFYKLIAARLHIGHLPSPAPYRATASIFCNRVKSGLYFPVIINAWISCMWVVLIGEKIRQILN